MAIDRAEGVLPTSYKGVTYRSRTEARWAVFLDVLGVSFHYEPEKFTLSDRQWYLPDFYVDDWRAFIEVKPNNDAIVNQEAAKARLLSKDRPDLNVWIAMGAPHPTTSPIIVLKEWKPDVPVETILSRPENKYRILEDRRDEGIYWLQAEWEPESFARSCAIGGPGSATDHDKLPMLHRTVARAFAAAAEASWK
ncbi:hypothetical protein GFL72_19545 [Rhizobium leguminosarum bv. viciae]|uniref:hypothetical protein n=1 Tax=Rhizobium leguminosarum TaxID=384 RepID=UPI0014422FA6|nr:hypothetical protein [Rhizobium leguminosarum]NKK36815.1 hypothetical protein [Rhizobium leguminosarum bv. viciae]